MFAKHGNIIEALLGRIVVQGCGGAAMDSRIASGVELLTVRSLLVSRAFSQTGQGSTGYRFHVRRRSGRLGDGEES